MKYSNQTKAKVYRILINDRALTEDKTPNEIVRILEGTHEKALPKVIAALAKQGIDAEKATGGMWNDKRALKIEGQTYYYAGAGGWKWDNPKESNTWINRNSHGRPDPGKIDSSRLASKEEVRAKQAERSKYKNAIDPLEKYTWGRAGDLKNKKSNIEYYTKELERAKKDYEKALEKYKRDYEFLSKQLAEAIGKKDKFMLEFRENFRESLKG